MAIPLEGSLVFTMVKRPEVNPTLLMLTIGSRGDDPELEDAEVFLLTQADAVWLAGQLQMALRERPNA
jgi:hypothetical protein